MSKLVIRHGRIIDPLNNLDCLGSVYIEGDTIVSAVQDIAHFTPDRVIDATNRVVCPGFIDMSVRLREPGQARKGNFKSETRAAAAAGVTTLCLPPDTRPVIDNGAVAEFIRDKAKQVGFEQIYPIGALTRRLAGSEISSMYTLQRAGCIAVSNAEHPLASLQVLRRAMEYADSHGMLLIYHPQEASLGAGGCAHEGAFASRYGLPGIPAAAETIAVAQCLELVKLTGCRVHFSRISCHGSVAQIHQAKQHGLKITADVAIHQLHLTENDMIPFDSAYHVLPPFRSIEDKDALAEGLAAGTIDAICSDHQPHDIDAKLGAFPETEAGIASLETLLPLGLELVRKKRLNLSQLIAALTQNPASVLGLEHGSLTPGHKADVCVFNPDQAWQIDRTCWRSAGRNTPYWNHRLLGKITHTVQAGRIIFQADE